MSFFEKILDNIKKIEDKLDDKANKDLVDRTEERMKTDPYFKAKIECAILDYISDPGMSQ